MYLQASMRHVRLCCCSGLDMMFYLCFDESSDRKQQAQICRSIVAAQKHISRTRHLRLSQRKVARKHTAVTTTTLTTFSPLCNGFQRALCAQTQAENMCDQFFFLWFPLDDIEFLLSLSKGNPNSGTGEKEMTAEAKTF